MTAITPWFQGWDKPVRKGVYQRLDTTFDVCYSYWNGEVWSFLRATPESAFKKRSTASDFQYLPWRGLTKEQK